MFREQWSSCQPTPTSLEKCSGRPAWSSFSVTINTWQVDQPHCTLISMSYHCLWIWPFHFLRTTPRGFHRTVEFNPRIRKEHSIVVRAQKWHWLGLSLDHATCLLAQWPWATYLNLSEFWLPHLENGDDNSYFERIKINDDYKCKVRINNLYYCLWLVALSPLTRLPQADSLCAALRAGALFPSSMRLGNSSALPSGLPRVARAFLFFFSDNIDLLHLRDEPAWRKSVQRDRAKWDREGESRV